MLVEKFEAIPPAPADPIIGISDRFRADPRKEKVNLTVGNYLGADGCIPLQQTVREAESRLLHRGTVHSYLPIEGYGPYCRLLEELAFGSKSEVLTTNRVSTIQALGGTGALYVGGLTVSDYSYYDKAKSCLSFERMLEDMRALPQPSLVLLQVCCHNPTGLDLSPEEWKLVLETVAACGHLAFLDMAYQGFAEGLWEDAAPVRLFASSGLPFLLSVSLSKGLSLYGERVGTLHVVEPVSREATAVLSVLKQAARALYSNPPAHGAKIAAEVLGDEELRIRWMGEVTEMRKRVQAMRQGLYEAGKSFGVDLGFALKQRGIFSFTGFSPEEMECLRVHHAVYGIDNGRIAMAGLTEPVLQHVAGAFADVLNRRVNWL